MSSIIDEVAAVSCYADAGAFLVMILLILFSERFFKRETPSLHIFRLLSLSLAVTCVLSFICHAMYRMPAPWCHTLAIASRTLWEWFAFLIILLWIAYVEKKLNETKKQRYMNVVFVFPFIVLTVLLIINLFTGIIFTCTEDNQYEFTGLYYVIILIEALYFMGSVVRVRTHYNRVAKICFIRVTPMILPVVLGTAVQFFTPYQTDILGFAVGALLVYSSMSDELRCLDEESGLYNKRYLVHLFDLALAGKNEARSALILETDGNLPAAFNILRNTLHQEGDVVRVDENRFLMFYGENNRSTLQFLSLQVEEAAVKYNEEHPEEQVQIKARIHSKTGNEDTITFLHTVLEEKEAGDEIRGIVSMMSELEQLDKELKLASDIQINTLPMNFPPFPDRTEFELYASMTPAKEVGGDFYDFFLIDSDHLALVIADVSGKGIPAALFMMVSKTLIKNQLMTGCDPATALERVNLQLCERNSSMMFVTVWLAVLEISTGRGMACNAGHEKPGLRRTGRNFELLDYKHNMFIGVSSKAKYQVREFELSPGDCVFVYTDGVPEATSAEKEMFGEERLAVTLNQNADAGPEELVSRVHEAVNRFADHAPQFDDITMLCLKYYGMQNSRGDNQPEAADGA